MPSSPQMSASEQLDKYASTTHASTSDPVLHLEATVKTRQAHLGEGQPSDADAKSVSGRSAAPHNLNGPRKLGGRKRKVNDHDDEDEGDDKQPSKKRRPLGPGAFAGVVTQGPSFLSKLPAMPIGAIELLTFFPNHTQWPAAIFRCIFNDWRSKDIAKAQFHARSQNFSRQDLQRRNGATRHQIRTAMSNKYGQTAQTLITQQHPHFRRFNPAMSNKYGQTAQTLITQQHPHFRRFNPAMSGNKIDLYDVRLPFEQSGDLFQPRTGMLILETPAKLRDVASGVVNWPTGEDEGQMTKALRRAQNNNAPDTMTTDDLPKIVSSSNFTTPDDATTTLWDVQGRARLNANVQNP